MSQQSFVVYLIGFPAAGKFTIAKALAERAPQKLVVVDNHHINNTVFAVIDTDGVKALDPRVWSFTMDVRNAVVGAIEALGPPTWSYVFTNVLIAGEAIDESLVTQLRDMASQRGSVFVPVRLHCDADELARRIVSPERRERMKWVDAEGLRAFLARVELIDVDDERLLDLDVTNLAPDAAADAILDHLATLSS